MKKVKLGEVLSLKKGKKATVLAEQTTLSQRYIQIDDLRNNNNLKFTESLNMTEALPDDILIAWMELMQEQLVMDYRELLVVQLRS